MKIMCLCVCIFQVLSPLHAQTLVWSEKASAVNNQVNGVSFSPDDSRVLAGTNCHPSTLKVLDAYSGATISEQIFGDDLMCLMGVSYSLDQNYIAVIEELGNVLLFDNSSGIPVPIDTIDTGYDYGFSVCIAPSGTWFAVGCSSGRLVCYNMADREKILDVMAHTSWVTAIDISQDDAIIVTGGSDKQIKVWSQAGDLLQTLNGHTSSITSVKCNADNALVLSSSKDDDIRLWDISTQSTTHTFEGHANDVNAVAFAPGEKYFVSGSEDATCKIWDIETGEVVSTFGVVDSGAVFSVDWSNDGNAIVSGNELSDVMRWDVSDLLQVYPENSPGQFAVFPNPVAGALSIQLPEYTGEFTVTISDMQGNILVQTINNRNLTVNDLPSGLYMLTVTSAQQQTLSTPFIKI